MRLLDSQKPIWYTLAKVTFVLYILGTFISRSLVNIALYLMAFGSLLIIVQMLKSPINLNKIKQRGIEWLPGFSSLEALVMIGLNILCVVLLIKMLNLYSVKIALMIMCGVFIPLLIWTVGIYKKIFSFTEFGWWLWLNGFLIWFYISYFLRKVDFNPESYITDITHLSLGLILSTSYLYAVIKLQGFKSYDDIKLKHWFFLGLCTIGVLCISGIPSLISLGNYWTEWSEIAKYLAISNNGGRLGTFHFVLDLGNILAQVSMVMIGVLLYSYSKKMDIKKLCLVFVVTAFIIIFFITTWVKLLIPVFVLLVTVLLLIVFRKNFKALLGTIISIIAIFLVLFNTGVFSKLFEDSKKVATVIHNDYKNNTLNETVFHLVESELHYNASFIYRLQHNLWAIRILKEHTLSGIGPYGYTDYVIEHFKSEYSKLPYVFNRSVSEEELNDLSLLRPVINNSILGPHADFVMIASSGGLVGMLLFYSMFALMISYFLNRYFYLNNHLYLGLGFGLLVMLGSGLTEPNFKPIHMYLLSFYAILFLFDKFLLNKNNVD